MNSIVLLLFYLMCLVVWTDQELYEFHFNVFKKMFELCLKIGYDDFRRSRYYRFEFLILIRNAVLSALGKPAAALYVTVQNNQVNC